MIIGLFNVALSPA